MASFIPHNNQSSVPEGKDIIDCDDDFYPSLSLSDFRKFMRVDDTVSLDRIIEQMHMAIMMINHDISGWRSQQTAATLAVIGTDKLRAYRMAVYNRTKALIIENYRDIDTTGDGHAKADAMESRIDTYLQRSREMQRIVIASSRTTIKLV